MNEKYISESCNICGEEFINVEDIMVDIENDNYICKKCSKKNKIKVSECLYHTEDEE